MNAGRIIFHRILYLFLGAFAKLQKATVSFVISVRPFVCPHGTTGLQLDGFSLNFIFEYFWESLSRKFKFH